MFTLNLVTPDKKLVVDQELDYLIVPAFRGELTVLQGHAPLLTTIEPGILTYKLKAGEKQSVAVSWGYCQISPQGVSVLVETASQASELDLEVIRKKLAQQSERLLRESLDDNDWTVTQHEIARLKAEIDLAQKK